jgi:hypothetical protein
MCVCMYVCMHADIYMNNYVHKSGCSRRSLPAMKKSYVCNSNIMDVEGTHVCIFICRRMYMNVCLDI